MLQCRKCKNYYSVYDGCFYHSSAYKSGYDTLCISCKKSLNYVYRTTNRTIISEKRRLDYQANSKPISSKLYSSKIDSDPDLWRARFIRQGMIARANRNGFEFDSNFFSVNYILDSIKGSSCPCCGASFKMKTLLDNRKKNNSAPSPDRLDLTKGYTPGNVVFVCWRCNNLKNDVSIKELETVVSWLENKLGDDMEKVIIKMKILEGKDSSKASVVSISALDSGGNQIPVSGVAAKIPAFGTRLFIPHSYLEEEIIIEIEPDKAHRVSET